jgi:hypothetical protein
MNYRHTLEAALESLHEIEELISGFSGSGKIPAVEIDLVLQKMRNMYELMLMFKKEPEHGETSEVAEKHVTTTAPAAATPAPATAAASPAAAASQEKPSKRTKTVETLADQFQGGTTLHESLHRKLSKEEDTLAHAKPVTDLLAAIGINDRYTFIRELFNGDAGKFESAVKFLNDASSFNDAYNYMLLYFNWDMESEPVQLLLDIIRRKYIKNKHE